MQRSFSWYFSRFQVVTWGVFALLALLLVGCGNSPAPTSTAGSTVKNTDVSSNKGNSTGAARCDPITTVNITEKTTHGKPDEYSFDQKQVSIKSGQYINFVDQGDDEVTLTSTPYAGLSTSILDPKEVQAMQFNKAGTFTISFGKGEHGGTLQVTVSSDTGKTCGMEDMQLVSLTELKAAGKSDQYSFTPNTVTVKAGSDMSIWNQSDEEHIITCTPDAGLSSGPSVIDPQEKQPLKFSKVGHYVCSSVKHPEAKLDVTVQ